MKRRKKEYGWVGSVVMESKFFKGVLRIGFNEKVMLRHRLKRGEGVSHVPICGRVLQEEKAASAKALRGDVPVVF